MEIGKTSSTAWIVAIYLQVRTENYLFAFLNFVIIVFAGFMLGRVFEQRNQLGWK